MTTFFSSDHHFGHENVIGFAKRPYSSVEEMDEAMIANWNAVVAANDDMFIVGDFSFHKPDKTEEILGRLKGRKHLIIGNHDNNWLRERNHKLFAWVKDLHTIKVTDPDVMGGNQLIVLCHYAFRVWNRKHYGAWNLHGHSHGGLVMLDGHKQLDVGVDVWNYRPVSYDTIKAAMEGINDKPVDHHRSSYAEE
jgi:calcineurin-like phosphoesterase family protein